MVDWWGLGVVVYELIVGNTPFYSPSTPVMFSYIQTKEIVFPNETQVSMSSEVKDFIVRCCAKTPQDRLGAGGSHEILEHPWFKDLDITEINSKSNTEYKQTFDSASDVSAFSTEFTS